MFDDLITYIIKLYSRFSLGDKMVQLTLYGSIYPITWLNLPRSWGKLNHFTFFFGKPIFLQPFVLNAQLEFQMKEDILKCQ